MTAIAAPHPPHRAARGLLRRWLARGLCVAFAAGLLGAITVTAVLPRLVHGAALTVRTGSMAPALHTGDLVIVRHADPATLRVGDIATYRQANGVLVTHRIAAIDASGAQRVFAFRGDANRVPDPQPVPAAAVRGQVWFSLPYVGTVGARLAEARPAIVIIGVIALSGYALAQFTAVARDRRRRS